MWLEMIWLDVRYALRSMRRTPGYAAMVVLSLALGIGATTAIFAVMDALLFRPLTVSAPQQLCIVKRPNGLVFSYNMVKQIREQQDVFSGTFAYMQTTFDLAADGEKQSIAGLYVSGDYFKTLGVSAIAGRTLSSRDDTRGGPLVCVISYSLWQRQYGSSPGAIGKALSLNGRKFEVVGVMPRSFFGVDVGEAPDAIAPLENERIVDAKQSAVNASSYWWLMPRVGSALNADSWSIFVGGRLKPGIDVAQAGARLQVLSPAIIRAGYSLGADEKKREDALHAKLDVEAIPSGLSDAREEYREAITLMMIMSGIVLVITCANVANILLARATTRQGELATRMAHGASRLRLVQQVFTETFVLSAFGCIVGVVIARLGSHLLALAICAPMYGTGGTQGQSLYIPLDARFAGFAVLATIVSALLFGLAPAVRIAQLPPYLAMKNGSSGLTSHRDNTRRIFIIAQVALSTTLLIGAGLLARTVQNLMAQDQGYDPNGVLTIQVSASGENDRPEWQAFIAHELLVKLRSLSGVVSASRYANTHLNSLKPNVIAGPQEAETRMTSVFLLTSPGYFQTLHLPLYAGRDFTEEDNTSSPAVAILSASAARRLFSTPNPIGLTFRQVEETGEQAVVKVVGVVKDEKEEVRSSNQPYPLIYRPIMQCSAPCPSFGQYELRYSGPVSTVAARVKIAAEEVDPHLALKLGLLSDTVMDQYKRERMSERLAVVFGLLALVQAAIGIYGVTSYDAAQRMREIGLRMALGARQHEVLRLILSDSLRVVFLGIALGGVGAVAAGKLLREMLFGVAESDPLTFIVTAGVMVWVAVIAALFPAWRALNTDPNLALRAE